MKIYSIFKKLRLRVQLNLVSYLSEVRVGFRNKVLSL